MHDKAYFAHGLFLYCQNSTYCMAFIRMLLLKQLSKVNPNQKTAKQRKTQTEQNDVYGKESIINMWLIFCQNMSCAFRDVLDFVQAWLSFTGLNEKNLMYLSMIANSRKISTATEADATSQWYWLMWILLQFLNEHNKRVKYARKHSNIDVCSCLLCKCCGFVIAFTDLNFIQNSTLHYWMYENE